MNNTRLLITPILGTQDLFHTHFETLISYKNQSRNINNKKKGMKEAVTVRPKHF